MVLWTSSVNEAKMKTLNFFLRSELSISFCPKLSANNKCFLTWLLHEASLRHQVSKACCAPVGGMVTLMGTGEFLQEKKSYDSWCELDFWVHAKMTVNTVAFASSVKYAATGIEHDSTFSFLFGGWISFHDLHHKAVSIRKSKRLADKIAHLPKARTPSTMMGVDTVSRSVLRLTPTPTSLLFAKLLKPAGEFLRTTSPAGQMPA